MGYRIDDLKKAAQVNGEDTIPLQQNGITKQVARSVMDQAVIVTASGAQNTGVVRKEGTYVLQNNSAEIRFTLQNAVGKAVSDAGDYVDSAAAAAGWIIKVLNNSTRNHTVISGANSWAIAKGEIQEYYWTGSAWTFHAIVTESKLNNALTKYQKFVNYDFNISSNSKYKLAKISITSKGHANLKVFISSRIGNKVANDGEYSIKIGYVSAYNKIISVNGNEQTDTYFTIEKEDDNNYYLVLNVNTTSSSPIMGNIKVEEVSSAYATVTLPESLTSFTETTTEIVNSKGKIVATVTDVNNALTDYPKKTNYTYCKSNDIVRITDSPSLTEDKYYLLQEFSVTWQGIQKIEILLGYDANYEKTRVILTLDNRYANNPRVISYYDSPQGLNYVDFFVSNDGNKTYLYARGFEGKNYITFIILDRNFSLKSNYNVPSNSYIGNVIHTVSTNGGKIVTDKDLKNITFSDTTHNFGNASTTSEVFAEFDLSSYKANPCAYIGVLRCGGASNKSFSFTFTLVVSYGSWSFVENSKSYQGGSLTFDPSTSKLRMTLTDKTIGLYEDKLTLLKIQ